jgi:hypothetical protein
MDEEEVQPKVFPHIMRMPEEELQTRIQKTEEEEVQTKPEGNSPQVAPDSVQSQIENSKGGGSPLSSATRSLMESRIGADFSKIKIHNDSNAHQLSAKLNAQAFATGNNIFFNQGKYNPESPSGQHLLAHELTHTVQQRASAPRIQRDLIKNATSGVPEGYEFEIGNDLSLAFVTLARSLSGDGRLSSNDLFTLRAHMINRVGTVTEYARLFMAGLLHGPNLRHFNSVTLASGTKFTFPLASITSARQDRIRNLNRDVDLTTIEAHNENALEAIRQFDFEEFATQTDLRDEAVERKIKTLAGPKYEAQIAATIDYARANAVNLLSMLNAMINGASDSTQGDRHSAAQAYAIAAASGHALSTQLYSGTIKVDALVPSAFASLFGHRTMAGYAPMAGGKEGIKGDTLYLKTTLNIENVMERSYVIHELNHAEEDNTANPTNTPVSRDAGTVELNAFTAQAQYILDEIDGADAPDRPQMVRDVVADWHNIVGALFFSVAQTDLARYEPILVLIAASAPAPFSGNAARVANLLSRPAALFQNAAAADINRLYGFTAPAPGVPGTQVRVDGFAGESIIDFVFR